MDVHENPKLTYKWNHLPKECHIRILNAIGKYWTISIEICPPSTKCHIKNENATRKHETISIETMFPWTIEWHVRN